MKRKCREGRLASEWEKGRKKFFEERDIVIEEVEEKAGEKREWFN